MNCSNEYDHITNIELPDWVECWHRTSNYGFSTVDPLRRTPMNDGWSLDRQAFDYVPSEVGVTLRMDSARTAAFQAWHRDALANGQKWFKARFMTPIGDDQVLIVKFKKIYDGPTFNGGVNRKWDIAADLTIYERPLWPDGWGNTPELIVGAKCLDRMMTEALTIIEEP